MILVRITMNALPEKQKELRQTLISLMSTPEKQGGYLNVSIFCDIEDTTIFNLTTELESRKHLFRYLRSHKFTVLLGTRSLLSMSFNIRILTVSKDEGIETVNSARKQLMKS